MTAWPNPLGYELDPEKRPAAVVLLLRGPLVLALTRKGQIADLHLPGGKREDEDEGIGKRGLVDTASRELEEETGVDDVSADMLKPLVRYVAHKGRPVEAFWAEYDRLWPDRLKPTAAGWPGWVEPAALLGPWCTYREEAKAILAAYECHKDVDGWCHR